MANIEKIKERRKYITNWRKNQRHKLRKEHRCIWCKRKVKPLITYPQHCKKHRKRANEISQKGRENYKDDK